jgi:hypothetical protein
MPFTTADLITSINLRSFAPIDASTFSTSDLLLLADEETQTKLVPEINSVREEFFIAYKDIAITANQSEYEIPARAVGLSPRDVQLVTSSGQVKSLSQLSPEMTSSTSSGSVQAFYLRDNNIILYPTPASTVDTLRVSFSKRPSKLIESSSSAVITAIDTNSNQITVSSIPSGWDTSKSYDLIKQDGGQECRAIDLAASSVTSTTVTFTSSIPTSVRVGDYVALQDQSPLIQLPPEYRPVLAQCVAVRILMSMRMQGVGDEIQVLQKMLADTRKLINPRVAGESRKIINRSW